MLPKVCTVNVDDREFVHKDQRRAPTGGWSGADQSHSSGSSYGLAGRPSCVCAVAVLALCVCFGGCVQRRLMIRSNPPGAVVYVDDYEIGTTPIATDFIYYGVRKIRLVKDGYETLTVMQPIPPPWYEITPLDFVSENLRPGKIRDVQAFDFQLVPQAIVPPDQLLLRAEALRRGAHPVAVPPAAAAPAVRVNPPTNASGPYVPPPAAVPAPGAIPAPAPPVGSQPLYPLPPR
jgi:hypothetical protein